MKTKNVRFDVSPLLPELSIGQSSMLEVFSLIANFISTLFWDGAYTKARAEKIAARYGLEIVLRRLCYQEATGLN